MLAFLKDYPDMHNYMPAERREILKLPRDFIINVGATIVNEPFLRFVQTAIIKRNQKLSEDRNMLIQMDPALAAAFRSSTSVSRKLNLSNLTRPC